MHYGIVLRSSAITVGKLTWKMQLKFKAERYQGVLNPLIKLKKFPKIGTMFENLCMPVDLIVHNDKLHLIRVLSPVLVAKKVREHTHSKGQELHVCCYTNQIVNVTILHFLLNYAIFLQFAILFINFVFISNYYSI
jgi:hypothetical protein